MAHHEAHCNADRRHPVGCSACSCEAGLEIKRLRRALRPFADAVYSDNGDMTVTTVHELEPYSTAYLVLRHPR